MYKPKTYNEKKLQLELTNAFVHCHDLCCDCEEPTVHSTKILINQLKKELTPKQLQEIKQCLTTTDTTGDPIEDGVIDGEDLDALFAEDTIEDSG